MKKCDSMNKNPKPKAWLLTICLLISIGPAAAIAKTVETGTGNDILWIILTVGLTMLFLMRNIVTAMITNPATVILLIVIIVILYILIKAVLLVMGVGNMIDGAVESTAASLSTLGR